MKIDITVHEAHQRYGTNTYVAYVLYREPGKDKDQVHMAIGNSPREATNAALDWYFAREEEYKQSL